MSEFAATFQDTNCGACNSSDIDYVVRKVEGNSFYEMQCNNKNCRARLSFGHSKAENKMYPKRVETDNKGKALRDAEGKVTYLENNGWTVYKRQ